MERQETEETERPEAEHAEVINLGDARRKNLVEKVKLAQEEAKEREERELASEREARLSGEKKRIFQLRVIKAMLEGRYEGEPLAVPERLLNVWRDYGDLDLVVWFILESLNWRYDSQGWYQDDEGVPRTTSLATAELALIIAKDLDRIARALKSQHVRRADWNQRPFIEAAISQLAMEMRRVQMNVFIRSLTDPGNFAHARSLARTYLDWSLNRPPKDWEVGALLHWMQQVKRAALGLPRFNQIMLLWHSKSEGTGKTSAIKRLLKPIWPLCGEAHIDQLVDERWAMSLQETLVYFCDELETDSKSMEGLKRLITRDTMRSRILNTNRILTVKNVTSLIAASNYTFAEVLPIKNINLGSRTGRRFVQFDVKSITATHAAAQYRRRAKFDTGALWRAVDPGRTDYLEDLEDDLQEHQTRLFEDKWTQLVRRFRIEPDKIPPGGLRKGQVALPAYVLQQLYSMRYDTPLAHVPWNEFQARVRGFTVVRSEAQWRYTYGILVKPTATCNGLHEYDPSKPDKQRWRLMDSDPGRDADLVIGPDLEPLPMPERSVMAPVADEKPAEWEPGLERLDTYVDD